MLARILKVTLALFLFLLLLVLCTVTVVDWTPYKEMPYYQTTMDNLEKAEWTSSDEGYLLAGWGSANITPEKPLPLIPYKPRGNYEFVLDSNHVKSVVIGNGKLSVAMVNFELLYIHPILAREIESQIKNSVPGIDYIYLTTTHTHSGFGGFSPGLIGKLAMGGYDPEVVDFLAEKASHSVQRAYMSLDTVQVSFKKIDAGSLVTNRLIAEDPVDPYVRLLTLTKPNGETAELTTYSAHSTLLPGSYMGLSGDYPYYYSLQREKTVDFSLFASGTVGSHRPVSRGTHPEGVQAYAAALDSVIRADTTTLHPQRKSTLSFVRIPVALRSSHFRISDNLRLRPWLFDLVYGDSPSHIDAVRIGANLFLSSSAELSGVFYEEWEALAQESGLNLFITCFNGGYIGYVTPDEYYGKKLYEVRDMNFFGPYNGAYHVELFSKMIQKAGAIP